MFGVIAPTVEYVAGLAEYARAVGAVSFTVMRTVSVSEPPVLLTCTTSVKLPNAVGVPVIVPFAFSVSPVGRLPENEE